MRITNGVVGALDAQVETRVEEAKAETETRKQEREREHMRTDLRPHTQSCSSKKLILHMTRSKRCIHMLRTLKRRARRLSSS